MRLSLTLTGRFYTRGNINNIYFLSQVDFLQTIMCWVAQSCLTLWDPMDYTISGIFRARILEWIAFPFSRGSSQPRDEPRSPTLQTDSLPTEPPGSPDFLYSFLLSKVKDVFLYYNIVPQGWILGTEAVSEMVFRAKVQNGRNKSAVKLRFMMMMY